MAIPITATSVKRPRQVAPGLFAQKQITQFLGLGLNAIPSSMRMRPTLNQQRFAAMSGATGLQGPTYTMTGTGIESYSGEIDPGGHGAATNEATLRAMSRSSTERGSRIGDYLARRDSGRRKTAMSIMGALRERRLNEVQQAINAADADAIDKAVKRYRRAKNRLRSDFYRGSDLSSWEGAV